MPKLLSALFLFATLVVPATHASRNPASKAFRATAGRHSDAMLAAVKLMPVDKYGYTPTRDGQRDFDFELGTWTIDMKRLQHPLSGSTTWTHPEGYTHIVQKVWGGQASLAQLANDRPSPHFDGLMLRMYDPRSHEWRIYWGSSKTGTLDEPMIGHFTNGRGEFVMHDTYEGKPILARVVYSDITPMSFRTESSFSADDGASWEPNLVQTFTRTK